MASNSMPLTYLLGTAAAGVTTGTSNSALIQAASQDLTFFFTSTGTTSGGTILIEETDDPARGVTWSQVASQAASGFTGGVQLAYHVRIGAGIYIRARISSDITGGGSVRVTLVGS